MISIIPHWAAYYDSFWNSISRRNLWFVKFRYGAVLILVLLLISTEFILKLQLNSLQIRAMMSITAAILFYNIILHIIGRQSNFQFGKMHTLHFSIIQTHLDLAALTLLIYYTGSIENPIYMFYVFHMIIGSLILPGALVYITAGLVIVTVSTIVLGEYLGFIEHHAVAGLLSVPIYNQTNYVLLFLPAFGLMLFFSVAIANKIASELYMRERDLFESVLKLRKAEETKEKYVMGIVHELKTPISAVETYLDLLIGRYLGPLSEDVVSKLERARYRAEEAITMINNVLHISKLRLLDQIIRVEIDSADLIEEVINSQQCQAEAKSISIRFSNLLKTGRKIKGDKMLLEIAVSNLLSNAVKYSKTGGRIEVIAKEDTYLQFIEVHDNGIGIPHEELHNVFAEFYRASNIRHKDFEGTGLGLSVAHQIIKNHGGYIHVTSPSEIGDADNPGTSFTISIPFDSEDE